jgi:hypothetical protein
MVDTITHRWELCEWWGVSGYWVCVLRRLVMMWMIIRIGVFDINKWCSYNSLILYYTWWDSWFQGFIWMDLVFACLLSLIPSLYNIPSSFSVIRWVLIGCVWSFVQHD